MSESKKSPPDLQLMESVTPLAVLQATLQKQWLMALFIPIGLMLAGSFFFVPRWETNDDVAMSMVAHGYGLAAVATPNLIFSQVVWGYIVRAIPSVNGLLGYSLAAAACLIVSGWALTYFLLRARISYFLAALVCALVMARPMLFPQFTITAGLLTAMAMIAWHVHSREGSNSSLIVGCLLAFLGYLIRSYEFILIVGIAAPCLPWKALLGQRRFRIALIALLSAVGMAAAIEQHAYNSGEWREFRVLNKARGAFTDFGAADRLRADSAVMQRYGYSANDVMLLSRWFFVDSNIANADTMNAMLASIGPTSITGTNLLKAYDSMLTITTSRAALPIISFAAVALLLSPRRRVFWLWIATLGAILFFGCLGRPGIIRTYMPLFALLAVWPLLDSFSQAFVRRAALTTALCISCIFNFYFLIPESVAAKELIKHVRSDVEQFGQESVVTWGGMFPYESAFPLWARDSETRSVKLYAMGVFNKAPISVASIEERQGNGFMQRLSSEAGLPIITSETNLSLLKNYCAEHLHSDLAIQATTELATMTIYNARCILRTHPNMPQ